MIFPKNDHSRQQRRLLVGILLLLFIVSLPCIAGEVNVKKLYKDDWLRMQSDNFDVISNASNKKTILMIEELENFNYFISKLRGYPQKNLLIKIPVILAKNRSSFVSLGMPNDIAGVFSSAEGGIIFARADKFRSSSQANWGRSVVLHELTHLLVNSHEDELASPPWYREGLAEYLGTYVIKKNRIILGDLSVLQNRFYSIVKRGSGNFESIDTESLFKVVQDDLSIGKDWSKDQERFVDKFYARSVAVVHFLNADTERRRQLYEYLILISKGFGVDESFKHVFNISYEEFDTQINDYIEGKFMKARVFDISENGIVFPDTSTESIEISNRQALDFLYAKISLLTESFLGEGNQDKMNKDIEAILPDFFE